MARLKVRLSRYERITRSFSSESAVPIVCTPMIERSVVVRYLTMKISQMIHDTVSCSLSHRSESDWIHAESIVRDHFEWFIDRATGVTKGDPDMTLLEGCSYEEFERSLGRTVWENARGYRNSLPFPPYGNITFF